MREYTLEEINHFISKGEPLSLYLYTPFCGACQLTGKIIEDASMLLPLFHWGKSNLNFMPDFAQEWKIESVPCLVVFQNKKLVKKMYTFYSVPYVYQMLKEIIGEKNEKA